MNFWELEGGIAFAGGGAFCLVEGVYPSAPPTGGLPLQITNHIHHGQLFMSSDGGQCLHNAHFPYVSSSDGEGQRE